MPPGLRRAASKLLDPDRIASAQERWRLHRERQEQRREAHAPENRVQSWANMAACLGKRYEDCSFENYHVQFEAQAEAVRAIKDYASRMAEHVASGRGIVLFGKWGTGKDHLLTALIRCAIVEHGFNVQWKDGSVLQADFRDVLRSRDRSEDVMRRRFLSPSILALSDPLPQTGELKNFQQTKLYELIDGRYRARRPTWITINVQNREEASRKLGAAIHERLRDRSMLVYFGWESHRKPLGGSTR